MNRLSHLLLAATLTVLPLQVRAEEMTAASVLATVNGTEITLGHMLAAYAALPEDYQNLPTQQLFDGLLEQMIQQTVLMQKSEGQDLALKLRIENDTRATIAGEEISKIAAKAITEEALQAAYDAAYANAAPGKEFNAAHILVDSKEKAEEVIAKLKDGEDFAKLAAEYSADTSAQNGGNLGWFGLGMMVKPFEDAVVALKPGEVSGPVESQFGWHVIKLNEDRMLETPTFDAVKEELTNDLRRKAVTDTIAELVATSEVKQIDATTLDLEIIRKTELLK